MDENKVKRGKIFFLITCAVVFLLFWIFLWKDTGAAYQFEDLDILFQEGWSYKDQDEFHKSVDLPIHMEVELNEEYSIEKKLPDMQLQHPTIAVRSRQQKMDVYVDDQWIYSYPSEDMIGGILPSTWNFVNLPKNSVGKTVRLTFSSPYPKFAGKCAEVYYGNYSILLYQLKQEHRRAFLLSVSIGIVGAALIVMTILLGKWYKNRKEIILGILLVFVSLWLCGETQMPLTSIGPEAQYYITFISLMMCPVCFLAYFGVRIDIGYRYTHKLFMSSCFLVLIGIVVQLSGIYDLIEMMFFIHVFLGFAFIYGMVLYGIGLWRNSDHYSEIEYFMMIAISMGMTVEVIRFYSGSQELIGNYLRGILLVYACYLFYSNVNQMRYILVENAKLSEELYNSKVDLMMSQIRPHFIFNTLNSIRTLIRISPDQAYNMVYHFANYLRNNLDSIGIKEKITFVEELRNIETYVEIEKVRFEERLQVEWDIRSKDFSLPPLCVQALVENAIKHGVCKKIEGGCVWIRSYENEKYYIVEVEDNGIGFQFSEEEWKKMENRSTGLYNIKTRLQKISHAAFCLKSEPNEGTKVEILFPKEYEVR